MYPFACFKAARRLPCRLLCFQKSATPVSEKNVKTLSGSRYLKLGSKLAFDFFPDVLDVERLELWLCEFAFAEFVDGFVVGGVDASFLGELDEVAVDGFEFGLRAFSLDDVLGHAAADHFLDVEFEERQSYFYNNNGNEKRNG